MKVVIFCGGKGYRLREETEFRPKPLVEIGGKPILWHIMQTYAHFGFTDFVLCLGYKGQMIRDYFLNYRVMNYPVRINLQTGKVSQIAHKFQVPAWKITLVDTGQETMTGARLKQVEKFIDTDLFMLTYGDGVANIDLSSLLRFHKKHRKIGTVTGVHPLPRFGELIYERNLVTKFTEKPHAEAHKTLINGGYFVFNRRIFRYLTEDNDCIFEKEPLEKLARDGELVHYRHRGFWHCMDTYRDMEYLNDLCHKGAAPWFTK